MKAIHLHVGVARIVATMCGEAIGVAGSTSTMFRPMAEALGR
jgi:hypothetical protein